MSSKDLSQGKKSIRERLNSLNDQSNEQVSEQQMSLQETIDELRTTLEEHQVAEENLREQNDLLFQAQAQIEVERQRYQDLFNFAPDGYLVTSKDGIIKEANVAAT